MAERRNNGRWRTALGYALFALVVMLLQSGLMPAIRIADVYPNLLAVAAAVAAVYADGPRGAWFGALCGLFLDALTPGVSVWFYTALLAICGGAVGQFSSETKHGGVFSSLFWSAAVLVVTGAAESLIFGVLGGRGLMPCLLIAGKQAVYSLVFAIPMNYIVRALFGGPRLK